jgi:serine/threonine protein kinase
MRRHFTAEGDAMATLADHPYIVQVFRADFGRDGRPYLVMKYYPQPNLGQRAP